MVVILPHKHEDSLLQHRGGRHILFSLGRAAVCVCVCICVFFFFVAWAGVSLDGHSYVNDQLH